jgi:4'-phosphopantetheinyl transferase EntD
MLTQDDYNFAFCAKELGYKAPEVAKYFGIKECTVYDWFNGRSRKKEYDKYSSLSVEEKNLIVGRVKIAELSGKAKV